MTLTQNRNELLNNLAGACKDGAKCINKANKKPINRKTIDDSDEEVNEDNEFELFLE